MDDRTSAPDGAEHPRLYGCDCTHSRHAHRGYGECLTAGCTCWAYRRTTTNEEATALAAHEPVA